eukprot:CAMPEP_0117682102 /NCGR_PEP_ID=MMETSP0804-20121206/19421_1 /TAXON_ID=1074897 /ORGANISM="Tetraselmis astigmatica, Strain CCMP880" /LENGTH=71 /DNA_ID=CAMNT_0005492073 /DNA_START=16 /DNA_END=231 /DNA_ORIENTATION=+
MASALSSSRAAAMACSSPTSTARASTRHGEQGSSQCLAWITSAPRSAKAHFEAAGSARRASRTAAHLCAPR